MTTQVAVWDAASNITIPADFGTLTSIECIGGGGDGSTGTGTQGGAGGGGAAYAKITSLAGIAAGNNYSCNIGVHNGSVGTSGSPGTADTWFDSGSTVYAQGGSSASGITGGSPGLGSASVGSTKFSGGAGGAGSSAAACGGGGGAAGPGGGGSAGVSGTFVAPNGGGGGSAGGGSGGAGGPGGDVSDKSGEAGDSGTEWTYTIIDGDTESGTVGSGGGGGGGYETAGIDGGPAGLYGGGGGGSTNGGTNQTGESGLIVITYTAANPAFLTGTLTVDFTLTGLS